MAGADSSPDSPHHPMRRDSTFATSRFSRKRTNHTRSRSRSRPSQRRSRPHQLASPRRRVTPHAPLLLPPPHARAPGRRTRCAGSARCSRARCRPPTRSRCGTCCCASCDSYRVVVKRPSLYATRHLYRWDVLLPTLAGGDSLLPPLAVALLLHMRGALHDCRTHSAHLTVTRSCGEETCILTNRGRCAAPQARCTTARRMTRRPRCSRAHRSRRRPPS